MTGDPGDIKTMKLYSQVERIYNELRALGFGPDDPLKPEDLFPFDQYHYEGIEAVQAGADMIGVTAESRVVELGSGIGGPSRYLAHRVGCHVTAVEMQPDLNALAAELNRRCGLQDRIDNLCGDFLTGIARGRDFDALVSWLCVLHIPDRATLFRECRAALKPGGRLFIEDICERRPFTESEKQDLAVKVYCPYLPSAGDYAGHLKEAGFMDVEVIDMTPQWSPYVQERFHLFQEARPRHLKIHSPDIVEGLEDFYRVMSGLFAGGNLGGVRVTARAP